MTLQLSMTTRDEFLAEFYPDPVDKPPSPPGWSNCAPSSASSVRRDGFADQSRLYQDDGSLIFAWGVHSSCHVLARRLLPGSPGRLILPGLSGAPA